MIKEILFHYPTFDRRFDFNTEELTGVELAGRTAQKVNEIIALVNTVDGRIQSKEDSANITMNRKLSPSGNFTGNLNGKSILAVFADIADSLTLSKEIISMINNRESIGSIYDGGTFINSVPPTITIEGGLF